MSKYPPGRPVELTEVAIPRDSASFNPPDASSLETPAPELRPASPRSEPRSTCARPLFTAPKAIAATTPHNVLVLIPLPYHLSRGGAVIAHTTTVAQTHSPLALWHLLSLDAPAVATLWLCFVGRATHTALAPLLAPAMFLAVWLLYAADRLLDTHALEPRHHFHQRHRAAFLAAIATATGILSVLLYRTRLPTAYFPLAGILLVWFAAVHLPSMPASARLPKELATGLIFAGAIFAPELPHQLPAALLFAALCTLNCAWIHAWETPQPTHPLTGFLVHHLPLLTAALILSALRPAPVTLAISAAAALLLALNRFRRYLAPTTLRASADLALLTPLLFWALLSR